MHVVVVELQIAVEHLQAFEQAMLANAQASREHESGCRQFDVCVDRAARRYFLYEVYDDESAFQAHLDSAHYRSFDQAVAPWLTRKQVQTWQRLEA